MVVVHQKPWSAATPKLVGLFNTGKGINWREWMLFLVWRHFHNFPPVHSNFSFLINIFNPTADYRFSLTFSFLFFLQICKNLIFANNRSKETTFPNIQVIWFAPQFPWQVFESFKIWKLCYMFWYFFLIYQ